MKCNIIQNQSKQLLTKLTSVTKPTSDVQNIMKTIIYLGTGQFLSDWEKIKQYFEIAITRILSGNIDKNWIILCEKQLVKPSIRLTILGSEIQSLLINCINLVKEETKVKRSKSGQGTAFKYAESNHVSNSTKIGALVKSYKEEYQKMMDTRPSLKTKIAEERENKHIEQIKEKIKRTNKNSFFISPKREQQEKAKSSNK